ncbi:MAG TPA: translocation/assembly module TamB domain-containing protein [Aliidongia sp.]|nr:translocation/assembly module TamB domain-containing protein [Aliidongia sp.]
MRALRRILIGMGGLLGLLILILVGGTLWLRTDGGRAWLTATANQALADPDQRITLSGLGGAFPWRWRIAHIDIADRDGSWLGIEDALVDIDGWALLRGTARIETLSAAAIAVARSPAPSTTPSKPSTEPFSLPKLPLGIELDKLAIGHIDLASALAGEAASLGLTGDARLHAGAARVQLQVRRLDAPGQIQLEAAYGSEDGAADALDLKLDAAEPSGDLLAQSLPDGQKRPLAVDLAGTGTLSAWKGRLDLKAGTDAQLGADLAIGRQAGDIDITAVGDAALAALLPSEMRPAIGDKAHFEISTQIAAAGPIGLDKLDLTLASGSLHAVGRFDPAKNGITARIDATDDLANLQALAGEALAGQAKLSVIAGGTIERPTANATIEVENLGAADFGARHIDATLDAKPGSGDHIHLTGSGHVAGITSQGAAPPGGIEDAIQWSIDLDTDRQAQHLALSSATVTGSGIDVAASGKLDQSALSGHAKIAAHDLARFAGLAGMALKGNVEIEADAGSADEKNADLSLTGKLENFALGIPAVDAALGGTATIDAKGHRAENGKIELSTLKLDGAHVSLDASGTADPADDTVGGHAQLTLPALAPIGTAIGTPLDGKLTLTADGSGPIKDPRVAIELTGERIATGTTRLDRLHATVNAPNLSQRTATIALEADAQKIEAKLGATVAQNPQGVIAVRNLSLTGPGTKAQGSASFDPDKQRADGALDASVEDLGAWEPLIGQKLGGRVTLSAQLTDLLGKPAGKLTLDAVKVSVPGAVLVEQAHVKAESDRTGGFGFSVSANGNAGGKPFSTGTTGRLALVATGQELSLATLDAKFAQLAAHLERPLSATHKGNALTLSGLAIAVGNGHITGAASYDGRTMGATLKTDKLAIGPLAKVGGVQDVAGLIDLDLRLAGPVAAPKGNVTVSLTELKLAAGTHPELPALRMDVSADMAPDNVAFKGRVEGPHDVAALGFLGTVPISWSGGVAALRQDGPLQAKLEGEGKLDTLSEIVPLGEDRISGTFNVDLSVSGTPAAPQAGGKLSIANGEYDNDLSGMTLRGLAVSLEGSQQSFTIKSFSAGDGGSGKLSAEGRVDLAGGNPSVDVSAKINSFVVARRDEITATLDGDTHVSGPLSTPQAMARLTLQRADINIPDKLPASVPQLSVIRVDSSRPPATNEPSPTPPAPPIQIGLDVKLHVPGQVFVRGRGLTSEWKGDLDVTGTVAYPEIVGQFQAVNGDFALLGTDFIIQRGVLTFTGGTMPVLDMLAQAQTADITAQVLLQGLPTAPTVKLTSQPELPQDEVLSRVLFGAGVGQITPAQGLELAQAAASLAGGGPGLLDRLRTATGLDRLSVGQQAGATGTAATTVSGGKYVVPGVFVGVDQGVSATSTRAKIEVTITPHISANATAAAAASGSSLGVQYKLDY